MLGNLSCKFHYVRTAHDAIDRVDRREALVHESEIVFSGEYLARRLFDALLRDAATLHRLEHAAKRSIDVSGLEQHVGARFERANRSFFLREVNRQTAHAQRVGDDQSRKLQIVAQDVADHRRHGGGHRSFLVNDLAVFVGVDRFSLHGLWQWLDGSSIDLWQRDVAYHYRTDTGIHS